MWKRKATHLLAGGTLAAFGLGVCAGVMMAQRQAAPSPPQVLPPGPMQEKTRVACLACHDARIMVQQQLDRRGWTKNIDKMIRWGAPVAPEDREAMIGYFAEHFGPREPAPAEAPLAEGPGAERVRAACLGCHDAGVIVEQRLDRRRWAHTLDRMIRWGTVLRPGDREAILNYLTAHYGPPIGNAKPPK